MQLNLSRPPFGEIVAKARKLNSIIANKAESKVSRNAAITKITALEQATGFDLRRA